MTGQLGPGAANLLQGAARAIHGERDRDRIMAWVADALATATGAGVVGLAIGTDAGPPLWIRTAGRGRDLATIGDPAALPALAAVLRGAPGGGVADDHLRLLLGVRSLASIRVSRADGGVHGLALLGWPTDQPPSPDAMWTAQALIAHFGVALDNHEAMAGLEAAQRGVVHRLQEAVRPPMPAVPHTELGVYYRAADEQGSTGGDLYDWILLPDGNLHLAVVDVMGKGVAATKDAVAVTHALRLLVLDGCPLERVIARADALVTAHNPGLVATLVLGRYDPSTGQLRLAGGGHPPVMVESAGQVRQVEVGGIPIGFPGAGSDGQVTIELGRGDTVVFYTDGLIETTKDIIKGLDALAGHISTTTGYPAPPLARALVDRALAGADRKDDSLALVLRRRSPPIDRNRAPVAPFEYRFTPTTAAVPLARHFLDDWLVRVPVERAEADDLLLVATELAANAVRHASGHTGGVALRALISGQDVVLEVEDDGGHAMALPEPMEDVPDPLAERGRGLFLVRALVDDFDTTVVKGRTLVRVVRRAVVSGRPPGLT